MSYHCIAKKETLGIVPQQVKLTPLDTVELTYPAFDESCLKAAFKVYQMDYPDYEFYDTLAASRQQLPDLENNQLHTVAAACGYHLENHHHALADAEACAAIAREIL